MLLLSRPTRFASTSTLSFSRSLSSTRLRFDAVSAAASDLRKDKADWKRRQSGSNFVDTLSMTVTSGKGGAGGVAFHREKFKARGPPSGGSGGSGGSVFLIATPTVTSLSHLPRTVKGGPGGSGGGKWLAGKRGDDVVIRVPVGTVVREVDETVERTRSLEQDEQERHERQQLEWAWEVNKVRLHEAEARDVRWTQWKKRRDAFEKFGSTSSSSVEEVEPWVERDEQEFAPEMLEALAAVRKRVFTMYPQTDLNGHPSFLATEHHLLSKALSREVELPGDARKPRRRRRQQHRRRERDEEVEPLLNLDLARPTPIDQPILLVSGGEPGLGNPSFLTHSDRSPKYATRGGAGETMRLTLEVKSIGEVGFVGLPNAGKSTLLRALTSSTPRVASFAFTTLNPHLGTCVVYSDGSFSGPRGDSEGRGDAAAATSPPAVLSDTPALPTHFSGQSDASVTSGSGGKKGTRSRKEEVLRFTITDNPGLLPNSHLNHGLGHEFLRHVERCTSLVYVVDLSSAASPDDADADAAAVETVKVLENSLREYEKVRGFEPGQLVDRVKGVIANKADLFGSSPSSTETGIEVDGEEVGVRRRQAGDDEGNRTVERGRERLKRLQEYVKSLSPTRRRPSLGQTVTSKEEEEGEDHERQERPLWVIPVSAKHRQNVATLVRQLSSDVEFERAEAKRRDDELELELESPSQRRVSSGLGRARAEIERVDYEAAYDRWVR